jgi:uncharacterized phage infection (PIP) family protein YhgE
MQTLSPLFLFSKLDNFHIIFRIFLLFCFVISTAIIIEIAKTLQNPSIPEDIRLVLIIAPSLVFALIITMPDIKKILNPIQQGIDKFIVTEPDNPDQTEHEITENTDTQQVQITENDKIPKIDDAVPITAELSEYDKKQFKDFKEQLQKLQGTIQEIKSSQVKFEKELLDYKTKIQDLRRKGSTKLEDLETSYAKIMAFKAEIDNPMNFIDKYFQMLNHPELFKKKIPTKTWKMLENMPDIDPEEEPITKSKREIKQ